jgi:hypothetical protein
MTKQTAFLPYPIFERPEGTEDITNEEIAFRTMRVYGVPVFRTIEEAEKLIAEDGDDRPHSYIQVTFEDVATPEVTQ